MANKLIAVLVAGVGLLLATSTPLWLLPPPPLWLLTYPEGEGHTVACDGTTWWESGACVPPPSKPGKDHWIVHCKAPARVVVIWTGECRDAEYTGGPYISGG